MRTENPTPRDTRLCAAYGCKLPGALTHQTLGTDSWLCFVHFGLDPQAWQEATEATNRLIPTLNAEVTGDRSERQAEWRKRLTKEVHEPLREKFQSAAMQAARDGFARIGDLLGKAA